MTSLNNTGSSDTRVTTKITFESNLEGPVPVVVIILTEFSRTILKCQKKCEKKKFISDQMFGNLVYFLFGIPSFLRVLFCHLIVIKYITTEHLPKRIQSER